MGTAVEDMSCISKSTMTEMSVGDTNTLQSDNFALRDENRHLKEATTRQALDEQSFEGNDEKVKYYTGLASFATFMALLYIAFHFQISVRSTTFQQYLVVLINYISILPTSIWVTNLVSITQQYHDISENGLL